MTCWRRLRDYQTYELWSKLCCALLRSLCNADKIDLSKILYGIQPYTGSKKSEETGPSTV